MATTLVLCATEQLADHLFREALADADARRNLKEVRRSKRRLVSNEGDVTLFYGPTRCERGGLRGMLFDSLVVRGPVKSAYVHEAEARTNRQGRDDEEQG